MNVPPSLRAFLWPASKIYGAIVECRLWLYKRGILKSRRLRGAVISVGNLTVGGTGKTPMVIWLAAKFLADGKRVAILTRGYRGTGGSSDEVDLMKERLGPRVRFGVGQNRYSNGRRLEQQEPVDIFLLDDGFQHLQLGRDIDIVMLDGTRQLKNENVLPAGKLREPMAGCERADLLVVHRKAEFLPAEARDSRTFSIFYSQTQLLGFQPVGGTGSMECVSEIGAGPFYAFCGIGNPKAFLDDLARWQVPLVGHDFFRDHHRYSASDAKGLEQAARKLGAVALVTTEKDKQNLKDAGFEMPVHVAVIGLQVRSGSEFVAILERKLSERRGAAA